jgi:hypothetical protein
MLFLVGYVLWQSFSAILVDLPRLVFRQPQPQFLLRCFYLWSSIMILPDEL